MPWPPLLPPVCRIANRRDRRRWDDRGRRFNESGLALATPGMPLGVGDGGPIAFALESVRSNPTRGNGLNVAFALPSGAAARLQRLDLSGRWVVSREVGALGAGRHTVNLAEGRKVAAGLYWVRLARARAGEGREWR